MFTVLAKLKSCGVFAELLRFAITVKNCGFYVGPE